MSGSYTFHHDGIKQTPKGPGSRRFSADTVISIHHCEDTSEDNGDADGSSQGPCRLHRRSALRRVQTLNEPSSPQTRRNRRRSPSTPNAPDPSMLQRSQDPGGGARDLTKFLLTFDIEGARESIRLPASKECDLKDVLEEALTKKGLTLEEIDIFITTTSNPLPKNDKGLKVPTEPLGGSEVFIRPTKKKTSPADTCVLDDLPGTTKKKKDLSAFLGVKDEVNSKAQMDPKLTKLQTELNLYALRDLPGFPPLLSLQYNRDSSNEDPNTFFMENSWKDIIDIDIQQTLSKKEKELQEGIWELLSTESKYIRQIRVIIDLYMSCLLNLQAEAILNEIETEKIFSNVTALESAHSVFWKDNLKKIVDKARKSGKPLDAMDIATAFEEFSERFTAYFKFCIEEESCLEYVREKTKENDILRAFFEWCEQHPMSRKLKLRGLNDLLVYPMQKITKYHLMVERVYKSCEDEETKAALKETFDGIVEFVSHINHEIKKEQERKKMERVASILEGYEVPNTATGSEELAKMVEAHSTFDVRSPMPYASQIHPRWLLLEGPLRVTERSGKSTFYGFLFTDVLVLAVKSGGRTTKDASEKYRIARSPLRVDHLEVVELKDGSGFAVLCVDDYNCAMYGFIVQPEKVTVMQWMEKIAQAKEWYSNACNMDDVEYFDDIPPEVSDTPTVALLGPHVDPMQGFNFGKPSLSPKHSPVPSRRRSNSPGSRGSNSSLQRMAEEEEPAVNGDNNQMVNGGDRQHVNNSNNLPAKEGKPSRKGTLTKSKTYQETDFFGKNTLLGDIVKVMPTDRQSDMISTVRQMSVEELPQKESPTHQQKCPLSPVRIMSFESDDEDEGGDVTAGPKTDIYFEAKGKDKEAKRKPGTVLTATTHQHRPSLPNIALHGGGLKVHTEGGKADANGDGGGSGTLKKKKLWEKKKSQNIR